jgi:signal transduction histidine kinase
MSARTDADGWSARLSHLASLLRADAIAIVLPGAGSPTTYAAFNVTTTNWLASPIAVTISNALSQRTPGQQSEAGVTLANGTTASSAAAAPIVWKDQLIGTLVALASRPNEETDMPNLARAADIVAIDLAEANVAWRAQRQVQDLEGRTRLIRELRRAQHERDLGAMLDRATDLVAEMFAADGVSIMLTDDTGHMTVRASRGLSEDAQHASVRVGDGISGSVAASGQPVLLTGPVAGGSDSTVTESMIAPLRVMDRIIGVINLRQRSALKRYTQTHLDSLALIAQDLASVYTSADELMHAEDDRQQAIVLYELSRFATLGTDSAADLASATAMLAGTLHHEAVAVWQLANDTLTLRAATGYDKEPGAEIELEEADTTLATVLRERKPARQHIAASDERPAWAAPGCTQFLLAPIGTQGHGVLVFGRITVPYTDVDLDFCTVVAQYLDGMLQRSQAEDVVDRGVSAERRRIAQEIHDGLAQELTGVVLALEGCQRAFEKDPNLLAPQLQKASRDARATLADVRQYMAALRQSETGALNLPVTLGRLVDDLRRQTGLQVEMEESGPQRELEPIVERAVIRIVGEALRNVAQHAGANKAKVALIYGSEGVVVTIEDDGKGFDVDATFGTAEGRGHFGVVGMRERAEAAGGQLVMRSETGHGTIVRASIPYQNLATVPGMTGGPIEDVEQQPGAEEQETSDRGGFFTRLFGR